MKKGAGLPRWVTDYLGMALWIFLFGLIIFVVVWCFILAQDKPLPLTLVGMEEKAVPEIQSNYRFGISAVQADKYDISSTLSPLYPTLEKTILARPSNPQKLRGGKMDEKVN